jgi:hypothetical protein
MLLLSESTLFFLNLTSEFRSIKSTVAGRVNAWSSNVTADPQRTQSNSSSQPASAPPSTIFSKSTATTASQATTVKSQVVHGKSTMDDLEDALVGGFDDVEVDESLEREAAFQSMRRGRMPVKVCHPAFFRDHTFILRTGSQSFR